MSVRWLAMTIDKNIDTENLYQLIRIQTENIPSWVIPGELNLNTNTNELLFKETNKNLEMLLDTDKQNSYALHDFSQNILLPIEWRQEAFRTMMPETFSIFYNKCSSYINNIKKGNFNSYVHYLMLYRNYTTMNLEYEVVKIQRILSNVKLMKESWAKYEDFRSTCEILDVILKDIVPPIAVAAPSEVDIESNHDIELIKQANKDMIESAKRINSIIAIWNSHVDYNYKLYHIHYEENLNQFMKKYLESWNFLPPWAVKVLKKGKGVYFATK